MRYGSLPGSYIDCVAFTHNDDSQVQRPANALRRGHRVERLVERVVDHFTPERWMRKDRAQRRR